MPALHHPSGKDVSGAPPNSDPPDFPDGRNGWWQRHDVSFVIGVIILVVVLVGLWPSIIVVIPSGHAGVYYSLLFGGTDTTMVCKEGFWLKSPWDKIYDYDVRWQLVSYEYSVISADGLPIIFKVSVRCRPRLDTLSFLQKDIGPDYIEKIIVPASQQAIRQVVGDSTAEKIYTTSPGVLEEAFDRVIEEITGTYTVVDAIMVRRVEIPLALQRAIETKLAHQQIALQYVFVLSAAKQEAERKRIEAEGIRDFQNTVTPGISEHFLRWKGIEATLELAKSSNAKVVVVGAQNGLPLILDTSSSPVSTIPTAPSSSPLVTPTQQPVVSPESSQSGLPLILDTSFSPLVTPAQQPIVSPESSPSPSPTPDAQERALPQVTPRTP
jgi:regulator of protease activity HflC (stomatin/prohibitin superfamily)